MNVVASGKKGNADLVAYFFLRSLSLLSATGTLGLIATNSVAQNETRQVGLDQMLESGFTIIHAVQSRAWPAETVNLEYAAVWGTRSEVAASAAKSADGVPSSKISAFLEPVGRVEGLPKGLKENVGRAFQGCNVNGIGFTMEPEVARMMIAEDSRCSEVVKPFLGGEDVNQRPDCSARRWAVDFGLMERAEAESYKAPCAWVEEHVRPHRETLKNKPRVRELWWRYEAPGTSLRRAISDMDEVLVIALLSKSLMPIRVPNGQVFSHSLGIFALDTPADQAVLSSSAHQLWAIRYGSGMRGDPRYTPSDVFETFARPCATTQLENIGRVLDLERREVMLSRQMGLTSLYNLVNSSQISDRDDADVARIREIHFELDRLMLQAYGWEDLDLDYGFHSCRKMQRWTLGPTAQTELLDRLLEENLRRAAAESDSQLGKGRRKTGKPAKNEGEGLF